MKNNKNILVLFILLYLYIHIILLFLMGLLIGDGTAKSTVTFDVIAISTVNNSLVSFYDITVLPFEYADYPIYQISDGETINC